METSEVSEEIVFLRLSPMLILKLLPTAAFRIQALEEAFERPGELVRQYDREGGRDCLLPLHELEKELPCSSDVTCKTMSRLVRLLYQRMMSDAELKPIREVDDLAPSLTSADTCSRSLLRCWAASTRDGSL